MSGFTVASVFDAIAAQLAANITGREFHIDPYSESTTEGRISLDLDPNDPVDLWVTGTSTGYGAIRIVLTVVPGGVNGDARKRLYALLSAGDGNEASLWDALYADPTFGGAADTFELGTPSYDPDLVELYVPLTVYVKKVGANA